MDIFREIYASGKHSDVTIAKLPFHRVILSHVSPVFKVMFEELKEEKLDLPDYSESVVAAVHKLVYSEFKHDPEDVRTNWGIYCFFHQYELVIPKLDAKANAHNVLMQFTYRTMNMPDLIWLLNTIENVTINEPLKAAAKTAMAQFYKHASLRTDADLDIKSCAYSYRCSRHSTVVSIDAKCAYATDTDVASKLKIVFEKNAPYERDLAESIRLDILRLRLGV